MSNTWYKREEMRKVTFRIGENEREINCVDNETIPTVYTKCEGSHWGVSPCISDSRY